VQPHSFHQISCLCIVFAVFLFHLHREK
jgi:hypothetical protein